MTITEWLAELGGVARRSELLRLMDRADLEAALSTGEVVRDYRGLYHLPQTDEAQVIARRLGGVLSLTSAALRHGWAVMRVPDRPHFTVSRGKTVPPGIRAHVHRAELEARQVVDGATDIETTLLDCLRRLPFAEGLAVADSARREGVAAAVLEKIADEVRGPGSPQVRRICREATPLAANPFESALRAIALTVPGLNAEPQVTIQDDDFCVRPDLVDVRLRVVMEADSFTWHGSRSALASDARRYNGLVIRHWFVLRFTYEDVMFHPEEVRRVLVAMVALAACPRPGRRSGAPISRRLPNL